MVVAAIVGLLGFTALAVDVGAMYAERRQLQTAADAAVLAGVVDLPGNPSAAITAAQQYVALNTDRADQITVSLSSTYVANDTIEAVVKDPDMGLFFARALGIETAAIGAHAKATVGSPRSYGAGVMPFGIIANGTTSAPYGYSAGTEVELVCAIGDQSQGNWHYLDLAQMPYSDANNIPKLIYPGGGTTGELSIGDVINTKTGSFMNPAFGALTSWLSQSCPPHPLEDLVYDTELGVYEAVHKSDGSPCHRLVTVPVITMNRGTDPYDWSVATGTDPVKVVGFLNMFVANDPDFKDGVLKSTFVQVVPENALDPGEYDPYAGKMTWLSE